MITLSIAWKSLTAVSAPDPMEVRFEYMTRTVLLVLAIIALLASIPTIAGVIFSNVPVDTLFIILAMFLLFTGGWYISGRGRGRWKMSRHIPVALFFAAAVYGNYVGRIKFESEPAKTTFSVWLRSA